MPNQQLITHARGHVTGEYAQNTVYLTGERVSDAGFYQNIRTLSFFYQIPNPKGGIPAKCRDFTNNRPPNRFKPFRFSEEVLSAPQAGGTL